jgi:hypothetical protein
LQNKKNINATITTFLRENLSAIIEEGISNKLHATKKSANVKPI